MNIFFAASTSGFFSDEIHGKAIPPDAVEITVEEHAALLSGQASGKQIVCGASGRPSLVDPAPPTDEELAAVAKMKCDQLLSIAALCIAPLQDAVDLDEATPGELASLKAWKQYRVAVNRVPEQQGYPGKVDWPRQPGEPR
ncbi:tail fiber assembly protein [Pseudomonas protegens]|uniref:tail fiber assembly protein n=1 Tax=Pseudomonas protegens TaxID=380021 RepID=UPI0024C3B570|nr:tail fiber assembly protein [Pseudomonas protegens]MDK1394842.1 tail fiber assembly protein [Pseudomonas protegens]